MEPINPLDWLAIPAANRKRVSNKNTAPAAKNPALDLRLITEHHAGSFKVMSILQCGHGIFSPIAWLGNSICPAQKKQDIFKLSGRHNLMMVSQCGQGIFRPKLLVENFTWPPHVGQDILRYSASPKRRCSHGQSSVNRIANNRYNQRATTSQKM